MITYESETWKLTKKQSRKQRTKQRAHERAIFNIAWTNKKMWIRKQTGVMDIMEDIINNFKWTWA